MCVVGIVEVLLLSVYSIESVLLLFLAQPIIRILILSWFIIILAYAYRSLKPKVSIAQVSSSEDPNMDASSNIEAEVILPSDENLKVECEEMEEASYEKEFMASLKKTLDNDKSPGILKTAYLLKQNGRLEGWEKRGRKDERRKEKA